MQQQLLHWFLEPHNQIIFSAIIVAFFAGLILGYLLRKKKRDDTKSITGNTAFYKGIHYLLSDDRDQAIEQFTKSVQINSDTIETYVALGNLYRMKGDIDRAIHIRQTIILRPNIDEQIKVRALFDLGIDYRKGGFLTRALETFLEVLDKQPSNLDTLLELEKIYEELKDWENAFSTRQKIAKLIGGDHKHILAHHQTEIGKAYFDQGDVARAKASFKKAISIHEDCIDSYLHLGDLFFHSKDYKNAIGWWKKVVERKPRFTFLAYRRLEKAYSEMKDLKSVEIFLKECVELNSDAFTRLALAQYLYRKQDFDGALKELESALELDPSFWEARRFAGEILLELNRKDEALNAYRDLIPMLNFQYMEFQCSYCGFVPNDLQWQCPQCRRWDTINFMESRSNEYKYQSYVLPESFDKMSEEEA